MPLLLEYISIASIASIASNIHGCTECQCLARLEAQPKTDCIDSFILPGPLLRLNALAEHNAQGGTIRGRRGPGIAAIFGLGDQLFCYGWSGGTIFEGGPSTT